MKKVFCLFVAILFSISLNGQIIKETPNFSNVHYNLDGKVLYKPINSKETRPLTNVASHFTTATSGQFNQFRMSLQGIEVLDFNEQGIPKVFSQKNVIISRDKNKSEFLAQNLKSVLDLKDTNISFELLNTIVDKSGSEHYKFQEKYKDIPIIDAEFIMHTYTDASLFGNGYAWMINKELNANPSINANSMEAICKDFFAKKSISYQAQNIHSMLQTGIKKNYLAFWKSNSEDDWKLVYFVKVMPNLRENWELYISAETGEVLKAFSSNCNLITCDHVHSTFSLPSPTGSDVATATDLFNVSQTINVWKEGSKYYLMDASRPMFNASRSKFPDAPVGTIVTLDGKQRSIEGNGFTADDISSTNNTWPSKTSVSAHLNAAKAYEYYRLVHARNSIDGAGGNIISIINVNDNGGAMDNAFWNGEAMFYGNGKSSFSPLAKGLDVAGHEMSHGVIGSTANLNYQDESGAINESYADVFGAMIDRANWKIGEDVVFTSVFRSGALRDLSDPHNGGNSLNDPGYQPRHVNEQYKGTQDQGGVHINSGIPNYAFYNFVVEMAKSRSLEEAKKIAERVYYCALTKYLTRSSNFKDLRIAIEKCCTDLYSNTPDVLASAKIGFDKVGISGTGGGTGGNNGNRILPTNPGKEFIVCTDGNKAGVYLYDFQTNPIQIASRNIISKPSVSDDGSEIYYVGSDKRLYGLFLNKSTGKYTENVIDSDPIYRNAVISKDGLLISVVLDVEENFIHVYDFVSQKWADFKLYNPSYSNTTTGDVQYSDVMDFDHSSQNIIYDAFNKIKKDNGSFYEYWDIGFINVFDNSANTFGTGKIQKLVSNLPEDIIIGNPVFSKNSLDVIAFDYVDNSGFSQNLTLVGANVETNTFNALLDGRPVLSSPNFSVKDNQIIFDGENSSGDNSLNTIGLKGTKIEPNGSEAIVLNGGKWGTWFATGTRKLSIGTKNLIIDDKISVRPNPFDQYIEVQFISKNSKQVEGQILNSIGQIVWREKFNLNLSNDRVKIETSSLEPGIYFLQVSDLNMSHSVKIIKE